MSLIAYIPRTDDAGKRLQRIIGDLTCLDSIEIFYTFKRFGSRLRKYSGNDDIALLLASTRKDLDELIAGRNLFAGLRIIVIVPDREKESISRGHLLRPRYLSFQDGDFSDVALVLQNLLLRGRSY